MLKELTVIFAFFLCFSEFQNETMHFLEIIYGSSCKFFNHILFIKASLSSSQQNPSTFPSKNQHPFLPSLVRVLSGLGTALLSFPSSFLSLSFLPSSLLCDFLPAFFHPLLFLFFFLFLLFLLLFPFDFPYFMGLSGFSSFSFSQFMSQPR